MTKYICQCCGEEKEDWPAIAYNAPYFYYCLSEEELKILNLPQMYVSLKILKIPYRFIRKLFWYRKLRMTAEIWIMESGFTE